MDTPDDRIDAQDVGLDDDEDDHHDHHTAAWPGPGGAAELQFLYNIIERFVHRIFRETGAHGIADIVQETILALLVCLAHQPTLDRDAVRKLGYRIARNKAIDVIRRQLLVEPLDDDEMHQHYRHDPWHDLNNLELLRQLMETIPLQDAELLALKYGMGLSNKEIAQATGMTEGNVAVRLHRVISRLGGQFGAGTPLA